MKATCPKCKDNYSIELLYVNFINMETAYFCKICKYRWLEKDTFGIEENLDDYK